MHLPPDSVGERIMLWGCPSVCSFVPSRQILLPRYLVNGLRNLNETYTECLLASADDLIRFWRSKLQQDVKVAKAHMSTLGHRNPFSVVIIIIVIFLFSSVSKP